MQGLVRKFVTCYTSTIATFPPLIHFLPFTSEHGNIQLVCKVEHFTGVVIMQTFIKLS